jgi:hypothetical protein
VWSGSASRRRCGGCQAAAEDIARQTAEAIEADRCYVFTHPERFDGLAAHVLTVLASLRGGTTYPDALGTASDATQHSIAGHVCSQSAASAA